MDEATAKILVEQMKKAKGEDAANKIQYFILTVGACLGSALTVGLFFCHFLGLISVNPLALWTSILWAPLVAVAGIYLVYMVVVFLFSVIAGIVWALFGGGKKRG
jgi:F0F1-type ATP synthase membrane subunit c/vacuolar-type H+-ATPase subunit K